MHAQLRVPNICTDESIKSTSRPSIATTYNMNERPTNGSEAHLGTQHGANRTPTGRVIPHDKLLQLDGLFALPNRPVINLDTFPQNRRRYGSGRILLVRILLDDKTRVDQWAVVVFVLFGIVRMLGVRHIGRY